MIIAKQKIVDTQPTSSGTIYSAEVIAKIKKMIDAQQPNEKFGEYGYPQGHTVSVEAVAFTYDNPTIKDDALYVDITILDTERGMELKSSLDDVRFVPVGFGTVDNENKLDVETYTLISIAAIPKK